jgi:hypothetical protein
MLVGLFNDEFSVKMNSVSAPNLVWSKRLDPHVIIIAIFVWR